MTEKNKYIRLWPTTIYHVNLDPTGLINKQLLKDLEPHDYQDLGVRLTSDDDLHTDENLSYIYKLILAEASEYLDSLGVFVQDFDLHVTKSWLTKMKYQQNNQPTHSHCNSHVSFCYYIQTPENCDDFLAVHPNHNNDLQIAIKDPSKGHGQAYKFKPYPGMLFIFPSDMLHATEGHQQYSEWRIALCGDIVMTVKTDRKTDYLEPQVNPAQWRKFV